MQPLELLQAEALGLVTTTDMAEQLISQTQSVHVSLVLNRSHKDIQGTQPFYKGLKLARTHKLPKSRGSG